MADTPACAECKLAVDVVLRTPLGTSFGAHSQNLDTYSDGFPPVSFAVPGKVHEVHLPENDEVVTLMLKFMHKQRQPDLWKLEFRVLKGLAEAAEKYFIYSAIDICHFFMREFVKIYPLEVLGYAAKFDYSELADACAPRTLAESFEKINEELGPANALKWVLYREGFLKVIRSPPSLIVVLHKGGAITCDLWRDLDFQSRVFKQLLADPALLVSEIWKVETLRLVADCSHCTARVKHYVATLQSSAAALPHFSAVN